MSVQDPQAFCVEGVDQMLAAAHQGGRSQIGRLLNLYRGYLLTIAADRLAKDVAVKMAPSDVVQETLLRAVQAFPDFEGSTELELRVWLQQILTRIVIDMHRHYRDVAKRDISREVPLPDDSQPDVESQDAMTAVASPSVCAETAEKVQILANALKALDEKHRQVLQLRTLDQLSFEEVGRRLNQSGEAARKLWTRAIRQLALKLRRYDSSSI